MDKQNRTGVERLVLPGNRRDICKSNRDLVMKGENDMKRPEFLITVTIGETREEYRKNTKALDNTMKLVMTGVWEESKSIAGESALNRGLTELIIQQEYIREREKENWGLRERPKEPEEDLKEIWEQVEEKAMEKLNRVYKAVEGRDKEALDKTHKEYFDYLTALSRTTGIELIQLDNHFGNLYWMKK